MRPFLISLCLIIGHAVSVKGDDQIPAGVLKQVKAATVFVKVRFGPLEGSGSGFLMKVDGESALLVTNQHVIAPPTPSPRRPVRTPPRIVEVVFDSGRKSEKVFRAEVLAADADRDLAILQIKNAKELPKALNLADKVELIETMPVYMFGFPFGEGLSTTKGNPAITVGKGSVSSIREDDRGDLKIVQIDGDLNPGNSGGPVVDAKGRLVGVAVAKLRGTHIGLAIPPLELTKMLNGRLGVMGLRQTKVEKGSAEIQVEFALIDPLNKISKALVRVAPTEKVKDPFLPDKDGKYLPLPDSQVVDLKIEGQKAIGSFTVKADGKTDRRYSIQPVYTNGEKVVVYSGLAKPYLVDFTRNAEAPKPVVGISPTTTPEPKSSGAGLGSKSQEIGDIKVTDIRAGEGKGPACLCWSENAKSFYHLDGKGTVRRIGLLDGKEEAVLETGKKCDWLCVSGQGLVLTVNEAQEMWLLDAKSLKVNGKVAIAKAKRVVSAPKLDMAFAAEIDFGSQTLNVIDLKALKVTKQYAHNDFGDRGVSFDNPVMTENGKLLFSTGGIEQVFRFKIEGADLKFEETSPRIIQGRFEGLCVSPDGAFVCAPAGGGNYGVDGVKAAPYSTFIYSTSSFNKPELVLKQGAYPLAVGFDQKAGWIYAQNFRTPLIVYDTNGIKLKEHTLAAGRNPTPTTARQFLVHPEGRKLLILGDSLLPTEGAKLWYVEMPAK